MKRVKINYPSLFWVTLAAATLWSGCTKQSLTECTKELVFKVVAVDEEGEEIDNPQVIEGVVLYVFDNDKKFLRTVHTSAGAINPISFPNQDALHVVSWGNLTEENQQLPDVHPGTPMHEALVQLKVTQPQKGKATTRAIAQSPDDLFYSYDVISLRSGEYSESYKLYLNRASAAMTITMRNLQPYANRYDENYALHVRETYSAIDFYGRLTGDKVGYVPQTSFNDKKEFIAPLFNMLPTDAEGTIEIDVYHDGELITTVVNGPDGKPLQAQRGKVLNILVNFHLTVTVEVDMTPWGETKIWKDF